MILFLILIGSVYATVTTASLRKSAKIPWQGTQSSSFDKAHNVGSNYQPQARFTFVAGSSAGGNSIVKDSVTNRMWQSNGISEDFAYTSGYDITAQRIFLAQIYCQNLRLGGYADWRLPYFKELQTIQDFSRVNPAIDTTKFTIGQGAYLAMTSGIDFYYTYAVYQGNQSYRTKNYARCVRTDSGS